MSFSNHYTNRLLEKVTYDRTQFGGGGSFRRSCSLLITYCFEDKVSWQVDNWSRALNQEDRSFSRSEVGIYKRKQESKKQENKNSTKKVIKIKENKKENKARQRKRSRK